MNRILMGIPVFINGPEGAWKRRDHHTLELHFDEQFLEELQHQGYAMGYKVFNTWLPFTQWEELAGVSIDDAIHFLEKMDIDQLSLARDELSIEDKNMALIPVIIEAEDGFNAFAEHYYQKYGCFSFPYIDPEQQEPMPEMVDDDDNVVEASNLYYMPLIPFEQSSIMEPLALWAQTLFYDGSYVFQDDAHSMNCRYMTPHQWVEKTVTLSEDQFHFLEYFHNLLEEQEEVDIPAIH